LLSISRPLSIQLHPDRRTAQKLNKERPDLYPDDNHKIEIAIPISDDFEALCGFDSKVRTKYPELFVNSSESIKESFERHLRSPDFKVIKVISKQDEFVQDLVRQFGDNDVGVLASLFLRRVKVSRGKGLFIPANVPHAYLSGDIVEVMTNSDNVIRAGLTTKHVDVDALLSCIDYENSYEIIEPVTCNSVYMYEPRVDEYKIMQVVLPIGHHTTIPMVNASTIVLVTKGEAVIGEKKTKFGDSLIITQPFSNLRILAGAELEVWLIATKF
jgi:mannose-6-phosphate isomerase